MVINFNDTEQANKAIYNDIVSLNSPYALQDDAVLVQAASVQNQWYTVLTTKANVRLYSIVPIVWNTNETIEVRITTKNRTITGSLNATHTTYYWTHIKMYGDGLDFVIGDKRLVGYNALLEDPSVKLRFER